MWVCACTRKQAFNNPAVALFPWWEWDANKLASHSHLGNWLQEDYWVCKPAWGGKPPSNTPINLIARWWGWVLKKRFTMIYSIHPSVTHCCSWPKLELLLLNLGMSSHMICYLPSNTHVGLESSTCKRVTMLAFTLRDRNSMLILDSDLTTEMIWYWDKVDIHAWTTHLIEPNRLSTDIRAEMFKIVLELFYTQSELSCTYLDQYWLNTFMPPIVHQV